MDPNFQGVSVGKPFLVTGLGASGTRFLAKHLGASPNWNIQHEPGDRFYITPTPWHGAVDSTVRHCETADEFLAEDRLWVVIRDLRDIATHCVYKGTWQRVWMEMEKDAERLVSLLKEGARIIHFDEVTGNRLALGRLERELGIVDIPSGHQANQLGHARRSQDLRTRHRAKMAAVQAHSIANLSGLAKWYM